MASKKLSDSRSGFPALLADVKQRIQTTQTRAVLAVNSELVRLYWDIGHIIAQRQKRAGWGAGVIPRLVQELKNEMPELKGFSERNIGRMIAFYKQYPDPSSILPQAVAELAGCSVLPRTGAGMDRSEKVPQPVAKLASDIKLPQAAAHMTDSLLWLVPWAHQVIIMDKVHDLAARRKKKALTHDRGAQKANGRRRKVRCCYRRYLEGVRV